MHHRGVHRACLDKSEQHGQVPLPLVRCLLAGLFCLALAAQASANKLELQVHYEGSGPVNEDHGLIIVAFGSGNFADPANPILATHYSISNPATVRLDELNAEQVWLMAIYDEAGGYASGPPPGPFGIYSDAPGGPPSGVPVEGQKVELRFDDTNRLPTPPKPGASYETLKAAQGGITEIRTYHIKPGHMDDWIRFFEGTLAPQAQAGLDVRGYFRSLDDENTFIWIRTFGSQKERQLRSRAFYFSSAWMAERRAQAVGLLVSSEVTLAEPVGSSEIR